MVERKKSFKEVFLEAEKRKVAVQSKHKNKDLYREGEKISNTMCKRNLKFYRPITKRIKVEWQRKSLTTSQKIKAATKWVEERMRKEGKTL